jgi:hypothetical protein
MEEENCFLSFWHEFYKIEFEPIVKELKYYHPKCYYQALRNVVLNPGSAKCLLLKLTHLFQ